MAGSGVGDPPLRVSDEYSRDGERAEGGFQPAELLAELVRAKNSIVERLPQILPAEEFAYSDMLIPLIRRLVAPDPAERFSSAEAADLADDGAASFHRELVKGDLSSEYENEIRHWIEELETDFFSLHDRPNLDSTVPLSR